MFCHTCGNALTQQMKFCNRCGAMVIKPDDNASIKRSEKRLDSYLDGLFWVTVFGLAFIFGGTLLLRRFGLQEWVLITYVCLSSIAFLINFGVNLWGTVKILKGSHEIPTVKEPKTNELEAAATPLLSPQPINFSVTENTTRSFEPVVSKRSVDQ